jgi:hypothetical protein
LLQQKTIISIKTKNKPSDASQTRKRQSIFSSHTAATSIGQYSAKKPKNTKQNQGRRPGDGREL